MPGSPSCASRMPLSPVTNLRQDPRRSGQDATCQLSDSQRASSRLGHLRQPQPGNGNRECVSATELYMYNREQQAFTMSPLAEPFRRDASLQPSLLTRDEDPAAAPSPLRAASSHQFHAFTDIRGSYCSSEASFTTVQRNAAVMLQSLEALVRLKRTRYRT